MIGNIDFIHKHMYLFMAAFNISSILIVFIQNPTINQGFVFKDIEQPMYPRLWQKEVLPDKDSKVSIYKID